MNALSATLITMAILLGAVLVYATAAIMGILIVLVGVPLIIWYLAYLYKGVPDAAQDR